MSNNKFNSPAEFLIKNCFDFLLNCDKEDIFEILRELESSDSARFEFLEGAIQLTQRRLECTNIQLTRKETDLVWRLIYNAREEILSKYGSTSLCDELTNLLNQFVYPEKE